MLVWFIQGLVQNLTSKGWHMLSWKLIQEQQEPSSIRRAQKKTWEAREQGNNLKVSFTLEGGYGKLGIKTLTINVMEEKMHVLAVFPLISDRLFFFSTVWIAQIAPVCHCFCCSNQVRTVSFRLSLFLYSLSLLFLSGYLCSSVLCLYFPF